MKVYLATSGQYSDYHVIGVFSDKKLAERFAIVYGDRDDPNEPEEFDIDEYKSELELGLTRWDILWRSKAFMSKYNYSYPEWDCYRTTDEIESHWSKEGDAWHAVVLAKSKEAALKIASEMKARSIANGEKAACAVEASSEA
jgi:hypothetical protein